MTSCHWHVPPLYGHILNITEEIESTKTTVHLEMNCKAMSLKYVSLLNCLSLKVRACYRFVLDPAKRKIYQTPAPLLYIWNPITEIRVNLSEVISIKSLFSIFTRIHLSKDVTLCLRLAPLLWKTSEGKAFIYFSTPQSDNINIQFYIAVLQYQYNIISYEQ